MIHNINNKQWLSGWDLRLISLMVYLIFLSIVPSSRIGLISALPDSLGYKTAANKYIMFGNTVYCLCSLHNLSSKYLHKTGLISWYIKWCIAFTVFVMPPPLGAGGIMFSSCPSVRPSEAWNYHFSPLHGSVVPSEQPWPFCDMCVLPSVRRCFREFAGERIEGMVWNLACWCILGTFRTE